MSRQAVLLIILNGLILKKLFEPQKRVNSPQLAAGLASESENSKLPYGRRFPAACCGGLQLENLKNVVYK